MPICEPCRGPRLPHCPDCGRHIQADSGRLVWHKTAPGRMVCNGVGRAPVFHPECNGCPCQHRPLGSWKGGKE